VDSVFFIILSLFLLSIFFPSPLELHKPLFLDVQKNGSSFLGARKDLVAPLSPQRRGSLPFSLTITWEEGI